MKLFKKMIVSFAITLPLVLSVSAQADVLQGEGFCDEFHNTSYDVQMVRQKGMPANQVMDIVSTALEKAKQDFNVPPQLERAYKLMVIDAYDYGIVWKKEERRQKLAVEFAARQYVFCMKGLNGIY